MDLINDQYEQDGTDMINAIEEDNFNLVNELINRGANINYRDNRNWTPLHHAANLNRLNIAVLLLTSEADLNIKNDNYRIPLHYAIKNGNEIMADLLRCYGSLESIRDERDGWTPLHEAAKNGDTNFNDIPNYKANINAGFKDKTPLYIASKYDHADTVIKLIQDGADVNAINYYGWTSLHIAIRYRHIDIVKILLEAGADPRVNKDDGVIHVDIVDQEIEELLQSYLEPLPIKEPDV